MKGRGVGVDERVRKKAMPCIEHFKVEDARDAYGIIGHLLVS